MKEDLDKWRGILCSWIERLNPRKMWTLPHINHSVSATLKIPVGVLGSGQVDPIINRAGSFVRE